MIKSVKQIPVLRYGLIVLLVSILFSGAFYLYLHYNSAQKLKSNIGKLITARANSDLVDDCLLNLYNADNNSRLYALTGDKKYVRQFNQQIKNLNASFARINFENDGISANPGRLKKLISEKTAKTNSYIKLRQLTDSLIGTTAKMDSTLAHTRVKIPVAAIKTVKTVVHVDTIKAIAKPTASAPPKKLFGRIFSAFASKKKRQHADSLAAAPVIVKRDTQINTVVQASKIYTPIPKRARNYYNRLNKANNNLKRNEHDILLINSNLLISIITELRQYKAVELAYASQSKQELHRRVTDVFQEYSALSKLTLTALIALMVIVLYNIWKIFRKQHDLLAYSEKAEEYANNKSNFLASMSHEIRTPLNSVIGFSEQLGMSDLTPDQTVQINAIRSSSHMLLDVVNEILDFSKYETGKMNFEHQPFMVHKALNDVFNSVVIQAAKKGLLLRKDILIDEDICFAGDMMRMKQVVMNLMVNAIKFTPSGEVYLQAMLLQKKGKTVLRVRIKDTGIGIKKKNQPMIFDEFSQVVDAQKVTRHKGTGLGLAICKKIIELQGGKIRVVSEPGKGSVFGFELPFELGRKEDCITEQEISEEDLAARVNGTHVLLAEDNQLNVLLAKTILKKWKITCDVAYNGQEAYDLFEKNVYDVVLTDIQMPIMGGLELLGLIRKSPNSLKAEVPVITLTANVLKEHRDNYLKAGANEIVLKPFGERNLIEKINAVLKTKYAITADILSRYEEQD